MSVVLATKPVPVHGNDMDPVVQLARRAHASESLPALEQLLVNDLRILVPHEHSALLLRVAGETRLAATGGETSGDPESLGTILPLFAGQEGIAAVCVDGPSTGFDEEATTRISEVLRLSGRRAMISVPLIHQQRTLAFLLLFYVRRPLPGPAELRPLAELAPLLASALAREQVLASSAHARMTSARLAGEVPPSLLKRSPLVKRALWALLFLMFVPVPFRVGGEALLAPMRQHFCYADLAGTIERVLVQQGDPVTKGQVLATLDDRDLAFEIRRKTREVERLAAEIELLRNQGAGEVEKLVDLELAILEHKRQEGELRFLEGSRDRLEIRSPVNGIVITERVARLEGRRFQAGELFCKIAPTEEMDVVLGIPESDAGFLEESQAMQVLFRSFPRQPLELSVARISPIARSSPERGNVLEVRSPYSGQLQGLRPGMGGYGHVFVGWRCLGYVMFRRAFCFVTRPVML